MRTALARLRAVVVLVPLIAMAVLAPAPSGSPAAQAQTASLPVGVQWHAVSGSYDDAKRIRVLDALKAAGVQWVRMDIGWDMIENQYQGHRDPYWVGRVDTFIDMAVSRGLKPMVTLYQTPAWARPAGTTNRTPPSDPATYASFARWAAARWAGRVKAWQVWNEPNLQEYWPGVDAAQYARLLRASYPAFKAGDPAAPVVAGAVSYNDDAYLRRMYQAGAAGYFDILSTHPYQGPADAPPEVPDDGNRWHLTHVPAVRDLMVSYGDSSKPIWFTEFGYATHRNTGYEQPWERGVTEQQQADYLVRAIKLTRSTYPYVTNFFVYTEIDRTGDSYHNNNYGLLRLDLSPKPAYYALRDHLLASATGRRNLLQSNQATFDGGTAGWDTNTADATLVFRAAPAGISGGAAELVSTASGATNNRVSARNDVWRTPVTAGTTYTAMVSARARTQGRPVTVYLNWFSGSGAYLGQTAGSATDSTSSWTQITATGAAPAGAVIASISIQVHRPGSAEGHLLDHAGLFAGSVTAWSAP